MSLQVAASKEDRDLTISEANRMKKGINNFAREFISLTMKTL